MAFVLFALILAADQLTKYAISANFLPGESLPVVPHIFHITYVLNPGAAFGMLPQARWFFVLAAVALFIAFMAYHRQLKRQPAAFYYGCVAMLAGAVGNLIDRIRQLDLPAVLVINKIDTVEKETLLAVIAAYTQAHDFEAVVPVSAKTGDGLDILVSELEKLCVESPQLFPDGMVSDQPERQLIAEIIREKLLQNLDKEVPHGVAVEIEQMKEENGVMHVAAVIYCERKSHKGIIIGKNGAMLKKVGASARPEIEALLDSRVFLQLWVKIKEDWRNSPAQIRNFGYTEEG